MLTQRDITTQIQRLNMCSKLLFPQENGPKLQKTHSREAGNRAAISHTYHHLTTAYELDITPRQRTHSNEVRRSRCESRTKELKAEITQRIFLFFFFDMNLMIRYTSHSSKGPTDFFLSFFLQLLLSAVYSTLRPVRIRCRKQFGATKKEREKCVPDN